MLFLICALLAGPITVTSTSSSLVYSSATSLNQTTTPLASNVYQNITDGALTWTFWLQLSSLNQNLSTDVVIISVTSGFTELHSLYLSEGKYLAVKVRTSVTTLFHIYKDRLPPFDQWFYAGFSIDAKSQVVQLGWRISGGWSIATAFPNGTPLPKTADAALTLQYSSALGYLASANLSNYVLDFGLDFGQNTLPVPDSMRYPGGQLTGGTIFEISSSPLLLSCPSNSALVTVDFASYGYPIGLFPNFAPNPLCDASALTFVQEQCLGMSSCSVSASNLNFGDPCPGHLKSLSIAARCSTPPTTLMMLSSSSSSSSRPGPAPPRLAPSRMPSPPVVLDPSDRNGIQNGFRLRVPLVLDIRTRSSTRNRVDAHMAVRDVGAVLQIDAARFVLVDIISNQTKAILTFTILAGLTEESLADGLRVAQSFRTQLQDPSNALRQSPLLGSSSIPVDVDIECIPVQLCPSGDYVCLSESTCPAMASPAADAESTGTSTVIIATATTFGFILAIAVGVCCRCCHPPRLPATSMATFPVSNTSFNPSRSANVYQHPISIKATLGTSADAAGFQLPRSGKHNIRPPAAGMNSGSDDSTPGCRLGPSSAHADVSGTMFTQSPPLGVADTMTDLEKTFATVDHNNRPL